MALVLSPRTSDDDFANNKDLLVRLYTGPNGSLKYVMNYMKDHHGWQAKKNQYEKWLTRKWGLHKYVDAAFWRKVYPHVRQIERGGQQAEVWIDGIMREPNSVRRELRRQVSKHPELASALPESLPTSCIVRAAPIVSTYLILTDLPFHAFEARLANTSRAFGGQRPSTNYELSRVGTSISASLPCPLNVIETALQSVTLENSPVQQGESYSTVDSPTRIFASPLHRDVLYSVANNFAGLGFLSKTEILRFLQRETSGTLYDMIRTARQDYAAQAIVLNLFRAAIDVGDTGTVIVLLGANFPNFEINSFVYPHLYRNYTPIEAAAAMGHVDMVKALLERGANVNLAFAGGESFIPRGAFECAVKGLSYQIWGSNRKIADLDPRLLEMLIRAGGNLQKWTLINFIKDDRKGQYTLELISAYFRNKHRDIDVLLSVFQHQDHLVMSQVLDVITLQAADMLVNRPATAYTTTMGITTTRPETIMDMIAHRGDLLLMQRLLDIGLKPTYDTVTYAISSQNESLVDLLLHNGANLNNHIGSEISQSKLHPLAAAINTQNKRMIDLIGASIPDASLCEVEVFRSVLHAAVEVGDFICVKRLLSVNIQHRARHLGEALVVAVGEKMQKVALALIDGNADANVVHFYDSRHTTALDEALTQQDFVLTTALLDADAIPDYGEYSPYQCKAESSALGLAVLWGDFDVVERVIGAGCAFRSSYEYSNRTCPLSIAIGKGDYRLIDMLIKAGCSVNDPHAYLANDSALHAATRTGKLEMVQHVFDLGADPHDPRALFQALKRSPDTVDLLLQKHKSRYPRGRPGWGGCILMKTIEKNDFALFKKMIRRGLDANSNEMTMSPFGLAIKKCPVSGLSFVEYLLQEAQTTGCTPDTVVWDRSILREQPRYRSFIRRTALMTAIATGNRPTVALMLRHRANVNRPALHGVQHTPLQTAVMTGRMELVKLLLDHGADVNGLAARKGGATALQLAATSGYLPIAKLLLERGADVDAPGARIHGESALEAAASAGRLDMVAMLLKAGAAKYATDEEHLKRASQLADENGHSHISAMLNESYGPNGIAFNSIFDFAAYEQS